MIIYSVIDINLPSVYNYLFIIRATCTCVQAWRPMSAMHARTTQEQLHLVSGGAKRNGCSGEVGKN